jgi:hypothetical protein
MRLAVVAIALVGCWSRPPPSQFPTGADALRRMKAAHACANGVGGRGKILRTGRNGRGRADVSVVAVNPGRLRIDVESAMGGPVVEVASNGRTLSWSDKRQRRFRRGPARACALRQALGIDVPAHALVGLLRGEVALLRHAPDAPTIAWDSGHYRIDLPSTRQAHQRIHLVVHGDDYHKPWAEQRVRATFVEVTQRGKVLYRAELSRHRATATAAPRVDEDGVEATIPPSGGRCTVDVPQEIDVVVPSRGEGLTLRYMRARLNPPLPPGTFELVRPGGVRTEPFNCR